MGKYGLAGWLTVMLWLFWLCPLTAEAGVRTFYNSPYVSFSPDSLAWTTNAGVTACTQCSYGATVLTGLTSSVRPPVTGQHSYQYARTGMVPVGKWVVEYAGGRCIHVGYRGGSFYHGLFVNSTNCHAPLFSGWIPYCADCGQAVILALMYMSQSAAEDIGYLAMGTGLSYFYRCPFCCNLEQGVELVPHSCKGTSWNRYYVSYDPNAPDAGTGRMADSMHMYNNAGLYEGQPANGSDHLSPNAYVREDYEFAGWNTRPDGTGIFYPDQSEIWNLTTENEGTVRLYAQWRLRESPVRTVMPRLEQGENVYQAGTNVWYVRNDGTTPFTLEHSAYLEGEASRNYQPNSLFLRIRGDGTDVRESLYTPSHPIADGDIKTEADGLIYRREGEGKLQRLSAGGTVRSEHNRVLAAVWKFLPDGGQSGVRWDITPQAAANGRNGVVTSDPGLDGGNVIHVILDGEPPLIMGMEDAGDRELLDRGDGAFLLTVWAQDALSGVETFYVTVFNHDNLLSESFYPDGEGKVTVGITGDLPLFGGDFTVTARAVDRVGNETQMSWEVTEFALDVEVERILEPHDPVFRCGESGYVWVRVWGYVDRVEVEFPEEMTRRNPGMNRVFVYTGDRAYRKEEKLQFMIPLDTPGGRSYTVTVRAYKGDRMLEKHPEMEMLQVEGTVLTQFRTRLR